MKQRLVQASDKVDPIIEIAVGCISPIVEPVVHELIVPDILGGRPPDTAGLGAYTDKKFRFKSLRELLRRIFEAEPANVDYR